MLARNRGNEDESAVARSYDEAYRRFSQSDAEIAEGESVQPGGETASPLTDEWSNVVHDRWEGERWPLMSPGRIGCGG